MLNCTELDAFVYDVHDMARDPNTGVIIVASFLCIVGSLLVFAGEQLVRPLGAIVGGIGGAWATFVVTSILEGDDTSPMMACEGRLIASGVVGVLGAALSLFILKTGIFILGAGGLAAVTHLVYDSLPLPPPPEGDFSLMGRSGYYYAAMAASVVVGGAVSYAQRKNFLRIASSLLGGGCFALTLVLVCERYDVEFPSVGGLGVLVVSTFIGVTVQKWRARMKKKSRQEKNRVPVGVPI